MKFGLRILTSWILAFIGVPTANDCFLYWLYHCFLGDRSTTYRWISGAYRPDDWYILILFAIMILILAWGLRRPRRGGPTVEASRQDRCKPPEHLQTPRPE